MKKIFLLLITPLFLSINAQETNEKIASVEYSILGIQTGFLGIWGHSENRLTNSLALRSELGFDSGIWAGDFYDKTGFVLTPVITLEPRYYYNLNKRNNKSRTITNNSGNFIALKTSYHPDWFVISNYDNIKIISDIAIIPTWGIRRNISNHFNYEAGIGLGYHRILNDNIGFIKTRDEAILNLHIRIGYSF